MGKAAISSVLRDDAFDDDDDVSGSALCNAYFTLGQRRRAVPGPKRVQKVSKVASLRNNRF